VRPGHSERKGGCVSVPAATGEEGERGNGEPLHDRDLTASGTTQRMENWSGMHAPLHLHDVWGPPG
jgi:hypothetical protein